MIKKKVRTGIERIAKGSCSLQGYCPFADAIVDARMLIGVDKDGKVTPREPSNSEIGKFVNSLGKSIDDNKCFCQSQANCKTTKVIKRFMDDYNDDIIKFDGSNEGMSPVPWKLKTRRTSVKNTRVVWIEDAHGEIVVDECLDDNPHRSAYNDYKLIVNLVNSNAMKAYR